MAAASRCSRVRRNRRLDTFGAGTHLECDMRMRMYQQSARYENMWQWLGSGGQLVKTPQFQELDGGQWERGWGEAAVQEISMRPGQVGASRGCRRGVVGGLERY
jgi:hypothetical protein